MHRPSYISVYEWDQMSDEERREELRILEEDEAPEVKPKYPPAPVGPITRRREPKRKPMKPEYIAPKSIDEAFVLIDGRLHHRRAALVEAFGVGGELYTRTVVHHEPCGERVTWLGRVYYARVIAHWLTTGERVQRVPKPKRYRAVLRRGRDVLHLGYYPSKEERDTVVGLARLGVFPNGSK